MRVGIVLFTLTALMLFSFHLAQAQQAEKVPRIIILRSGSPSPSRSAPVYADELRIGLRELGYVEGQNVSIEYRYLDMISKLADELELRKVDLIVTAPAPKVVHAARRLTRTIPIVMSGVTFNPVKAGFAISLARPGGNITGLVSLSLQLHGKRMEILKEAFPQISSVAIIVSPNPGVNIKLLKKRQKELNAVGEALGIESVAFVGSENIKDVFSTISQERHEAILVPSTGYTIARRARIIEFAANRRLPAIYSQSDFVEAGGLMSYATDHNDVYRRAASYVDKIFKGAKPADLPIEQPTKFELVINLKTANEIGLTVTPNVLARANKVIR